jgi:TPR repeat protein
VGAFEQFSKAATYGNAAAQAYLAFMLDNGKGVPVDHSQVGRSARFVELVLVSAAPRIHFLLSFSSSSATTTTTTTNYYYYYYYYLMLLLLLLCVGIVVLFFRGSRWRSVRDSSTCQQVSSG